MAGLISYESASDGYQPGVCNIGPVDIARRRRVGYVGVAVAIALAAVMLLADASSFARLLVALPLFAGFSGFIQARARFCANYGWRGITAPGEVSDARTVDDAGSRAADRRRSFEILAASAIGGLSVAIPFALLPA
jgi:hypothetical protein